MTAKPQKLVAGVSPFVPPAAYPERGSADLRPEHREYLRARGITDLEYLRRAGVRSGVGELIFCYYDPETGAFLRDFARVAPFPRPKKNKFRQPIRSSNHLYFAPVVDRPALADVLGDPTADLYLCEGETRALALGAHGLFAVAIGGINSFRTRTVDGLSISLPEFDLINLRNRNVVVCFDHDATSPEAATQKRLALASLCTMLDGKGARSWFIQTPKLTDDAKTGIDDVIAAEGVRFFLALPRRSLSEDEFKEWARGGIFTDRENSEKFARLFADRARYVPGLKSWLLWDGARWVFDDANRVLQLGGELADDWRITARELQSADDRKRQLAWAIACESLNVVRNAVALAATHPRLIVPTQLLDRHPLKLGVQNGVIDLTTGALVAPDREWLLTRQVPIDFDPRAKCPEWLAFLKRTFRGRPAVIAYLRRVVGYWLTGDMREQAFFIFFGLHGNNGKGTLIRAVKGLLGAYFETSELATWTRQVDLRAGGTRNDLIALRGARLVVVHEPEKQHPFDGALIKRITGQDDVSARGNYSPQVNFTPEFKIVIVSNHKPKLDPTDAALWRRVHFIEFKERFEGAAKIEDLDARLAAELPGILNWAIAGCVEWQRDGLAPPAEIAAATVEYRRESDRFAEFLEDETRVGPKYWSATDALYRAYQGWCERQGLDHPMTKRSFADELKNRGFTARFRKTKGKKERGWTGLELTPGGQQRAVCGEKA